MIASRNPSDLAHSLKCARTIEQYYKRQGITVRVWLEDVRVSNFTADTYPAIRSEIRMGKP